MVLTNLTAQPVPKLLVYHVLDLLLGLRPAPWLRRMREQTAREQREQKARKRKAARARRKGGRRPRALRAYVGRYNHPGYGPMTIELSGGKLQALGHGVTHALRHHHGDIFAMARPLWDAESKLSFLADAEGQIDRVSAPFESSVEPIVFRRVPQQAKPGASKRGS